MSRGVGPCFTTWSASSEKDKGANQQSTSCASIPTCPDIGKFVLMLAVTSSAAKEVDLLWLGPERSWALWREGGSYRQMPTVFQKQQ